MTDLSATLGESLCTKLNASKILVVGAGGIGCELLKNLVLSGFLHIEIVDLDTIDVSNLNRQFLFRSHHVGLSKAQVAKEIALEFNPAVNITAHHGNIKKPEFGLEYFRQFTLVLNALDNVDARRHVNRLCLATDTPLIESGTTGYLGQVSVIQKGKTECYECTTKVTQKVYPICTIRSTPDKPVHCIVWAKEFYKLLFGKMDDSMLWEDPEGEEVSVFMDKIQRPKDAPEGNVAYEHYAHEVFRGLFHLEIEKKIDMNLYKGASTTPVPLCLENLLSSANEPIVQEKNKSSSLPDQQIWTVGENAQHFIQAIVKMYATAETRNLIGSCEFDKDDPIAMEFVTAAANLRSSIFHIPLQSLYDAKGIAGNIIPAIATTNAIIAGLQVLEAFKIIQSPDAISTKCKYTYCYRLWDSRGVLLNPIALASPNATCYVCTQSFVELEINTKTTTLDMLIQRVLKKKLGVNEPSISIGANTIYEEGEDAEVMLQQNLSKLLVDLPGGGIRHGTTFEIEDFTQDFTCNLVAVHRDEFDEEECPEQFILGRSGESTRGGQETSTVVANEIDTPDDEIEVVLSPVEQRKKRELGEREPMEVTKKLKTL